MPSVSADLRRPGLVLRGVLRDPRGQRRRDGRRRALVGPQRAAGAAARLGGGLRGGLLLAGLAPGIELFVAARFLQGLGAGAMTVALYVVVARIYAPIDHPRIFGAFAAAWVIPSMVGPSVAGVVAGGVRVALGLPRRRRVGGRGDRHAAAGAAGHRRQPGAILCRRLAAGSRLSVVVAGAVVALDLAGRASAGLRLRGGRRRTGGRGARRTPAAAGRHPRACAAGSRRSSRCAAPSRRRSSRPRSTCPTCSRSTTTCRRGCPGPTLTVGALGWAARLAGAGPARCPVRPLRCAPDRGRAPAGRHRRGAGGDRAAG